MLDRALQQLLLSVVGLLLLTLVGLLLYEPLDSPGRLLSCIGQRSFILSHFHSLPQLSRDGFR